MYTPQDKLLTFIVDSGLVSRTDADAALKKAKEKGTTLGEVLVSDGAISEDDLRHVEATVLGIPFVDLSKEKIDFNVLSLIPEPVARANNIVAYRKGVRGLEVAMLDVDDLKAIDFIKKKVGLKILPRLTDTNSIKEALKQYQKSLKAEFGDIIKKDADLLQSSLAREAPGEDASEADLRKMAEDLPVVRIVDTLIKHAILQDASDIHIEPMENQLVVRYRIDGILHDAMTLPKHAAAGITARIKVLAKLKLDEKRLPQDGRFKVDTGDERVSFRVSTLPINYGEKTVMRLLKETSKGFTLESLGFHGIGLERIHRATKQTTGMILATGPTGSGKTTTLYTVLDILNTPDVNISTIEDPIEYQVPRINQTQVKPEIGLTFGNGLRALVRQDPDIIMVGEIRDTETAALAVNAALTGHLVLSTLHTNSAAGAIPRLIDMEVQPFLLASTIKVIIGQRLVRTLAEGKEKYTLSKSELATLKKSVDTERVLNQLKEEEVVSHDASWETIPFYKPRASTEHPDGFHGRIGIHEVLEVGAGIRELMVGKVADQDIEAQAKTEGMLSMIEDGVFKAVQGVTTLEEVLRVVSE